MLKIMDIELFISNNFVANLVDALGILSLLCVMGNIMLFNLKEAGEQELDQGSSYKANSVSDIEFA